MGEVLRKNTADRDCGVKERKKTCWETQKNLWPNGKELNPPKSAPIFHELDRIYHEKGSDKISMIQSAALYNAQ